MLTKSVDTQNGQYRAKHRSFGYEGVCNEQMSAPKGKVCSELRRNTEKAAETSVSRESGVTNRYHKTTNSPVRFVRPGPQGNVADLTWESLEYMGRPWYWDQMVPLAMAA